MNDNGRKICNNCFRQIKTEPCKYCGYKKSAYRPEAGILPVGTVLKKRYCIGEVLGKGGFGVTYKQLICNIRKITEHMQANCRQFSQ